MNGECTIRVRAFAAFKVTFDGDPVERWHAGKARKLLQFLLLHRDRPVSRDVLHEALWPDSPGSPNSSSLKVAVHALRKVLHRVEWPSVARGSASSLRVHTSHAGYKLETHNVWTDFGEFESLVDRAHGAQKQGDLRSADDLYGRAVALYEGDFLPDLPDDWATSHREWLRSRQLVALGYLSARQLERGDHLGVIDLCQRILAVDPLHEDSYRMLIALHGQLGQLSQTQRWYRLCVNRLRDDLQMSPSPETERVYKLALRGRQVLVRHSLWAAAS